MIKLYHYSNEDFKGYIRPGLFGLNSYSKNSERISRIKRSYFYLRPGQREYYFEGCRFLYIAEISEAKLYDINKDILRLAGRGKDIFAEIKKRGYRGLLGSNGYNCGVLFYPIKIKSQARLTK